jgi:hypothetical protein
MSHALKPYLEMKNSSGLPSSDGLLDSIPNPCKES